MSLPILDIGSIGLNVADENLDQSDLQKKAQELVDVFSDVGFVYLKNHGIGQQQVKDIHSVAEQFFALPDEAKEKYHNVRQFGWDRFKEEGLNPFERPADLKENFNVIPRQAQNHLWPDEDVPEFRDTSLEFFTSCRLLCKRLFMALAVGLGLEDKEFFTSRHTPHEKPNGTCVRMLHYPPVPKDVKAGQIRLGEHTDYGSMTLLFQGSVGGLEVLSKEGDWIEAPGIQDTILVNIGDMLQCWTSHKLRSTPHKVRIPEDDILVKKSRYSVVYFCHPDAEVVIQPINKSAEYFPEFTAGQYLAKRLSEIRPGGFDASYFK